jgi:hypothetical protein
MNLDEFHYNNLLYKRSVVMTISDEEIAKALDKRPEEIAAIKKENPEEYEILRFGVLCQKLSLTPDDLEKFAKVLEMEKEEER